MRFVFMFPDGEKCSDEMTKEELLEVIQHIAIERDYSREQVQEMAKLATMRTHARH